MNNPRHNLVGFGDSGTYQDLNEEELQEFFNEYSDRPLKGWPGPWRWIAFITTGSLKKDGLIPTLFTR